MSDKFSKDLATYYSLLSELIASGHIAEARRLGMTEEQIERLLQLIAKDGQSAQVAKRRLLEAGQTLLHVSKHLENTVARGEADAEILSAALLALDHCDFDRAASLLQELEAAVSTATQSAANVSDSEVAQAAFARGELAASMNRWDEAYEHFARAVSVVPEDWEYLSKASTFAWRNGRYAEALDFDRRRLQVAEQSGDPRKVSDALIDLGLTFKELGRLPEAISLYHRAIELDIRDLGAEHTEVAIDYGNLAIALHDVGSFDDAVVYAEKAVAIGSAQLSESDSKLLSWKNTLAGLYHVKGRHEEGLRLLETVLATAEQSVPEDDPSLAPKLVNLGRMYEESGRTQDAQRLFLRALRIYENTYSPDGFAATGVLNRLGKMSQRLGDHSAALLYFERAQEILRRHSSNDSLDYAAVANNLGVLYGYMGRFKDAIPLVARSLEIRQALLPVDHPYISIARENLASISGAADYVTRLQ